MKSMFTCILFLCALALTACMFDTTKGPTIYQTTYTLSLKSLPDSLPLDSVRLNVFLNGKSDTTIGFTSLQANTSTRKVEFMLPALAGQTLKVEYSVYSESHRVAFGFDPFIPSGKSPLPPDSLQIDSLQLDSAIAAIPRVNEALTVSFSRSATEVLEGNSPSIHLVLGGDPTARLATNHTIQVQCIGGSVTSSNYSLTGQVTIPKGAKYGDSMSVSFASLTDAKVMGDLTAFLKISDASGLQLGAISLDTIAIHDADTAWVEFVRAKDSALESAGLVSIPAQLRISPSTSSLGAAITAKAIFQQGSALLNYDYTVTNSSVNFAAGIQNGASQNFSVTLVNNTLHDSLDKKFTASVSISSGSAIAGTQKLMFTINNDNYEYVVVVDNVAGIMSLYTPEGALAKSVTNASLKGTRGIVVDSLNEIIVVKDNAIILFNPLTNTATPWSETGAWQALATSGTKVIAVDASADAVLYGNTGTKVGSITVPYGSSAGVDAVYDSLSGFVFYAAVDCAVSCATGGKIARGAWGSALQPWLSTLTSDSLGKPAGLAIASGNLWSLTTDGSSASNLIEINTLTGAVVQTYDLSTDVPNPIRMVASPLGHLFILSGSAGAGYHIVEYNPNAWAGELTVPHHWDLSGSYAAGGVGYLRTHTKMVP